MKTLNPIIYLTLFLAIGLVGKVSAEAGDQVCYPGDNITDSKLDLKFKTIRKPTLDFWEEYWPYVRSLAEECLFRKIKYPETHLVYRGNHHRTETNAKQHCHPFTQGSLLRGIVNWSGAAYKAQNNPFDNSFI